MSSTSRPTRNRFELEALEPRVLLSADGILPVAAVAQSMVHKPAETVQHTVAPTQLFASEQIHYASGQETENIFEGVSAHPVSSAPPASAHSGNTESVTVAAEVAPQVGQTGSTVQKTAQTGVVHYSVLANNSTTTSSSSKVSSSSNAAAPTNGTAQQLTNSLTAANGPPASSTVSQPVPIQTLQNYQTQSKNTGVSSSSPSVSPASNGSIDLLSEINTLIGSITSSSTGTSVTFAYSSYSALTSIGLGGVLKLTNVSVTVGFQVSNSSVTINSIAFSAQTATFNLGSTFQSSITGISATVTKNTQSNLSDASVKLTLGNGTEGSVMFSVSSFLEVGAAGATLYYTGPGTANGQSVNLINGQGAASSDNVTLMSLGLQGAYAFVGINGPSGGVTSTAPSSPSEGIYLSSVNLALVVMNSTSSSGAVYYGLSASGSATSVGLPGSIAMSVSNVSVQINGGNAAANGNVVDFNTTTSSGFTPGSGYSVSLSSTTSTSLDFSQPLVQASGTIDLSFGGFVYVMGSVFFQEGTQSTVNTTNGTVSNGSVVDNGTATVSMLEVIASGVTVFAGVNGPTASNPGVIPSNAVGVEIQNASFTLILMDSTTSGGPNYYYIQAGAGSVQNLIPGSNQTPQSLPVYNSTTGDYTLTGLTVGNYYQWTPYQPATATNPSNDVSLINGTTTITSPGVFQATSTSVTLTGQKGTSVTAAVTLYEGVRGLGLPKGFSIGLGDISVLINGGTNGDAVDFASSFTTTPPTGNAYGGLTIQTASVAAFVNTAAPVVSVSGSLTLNLDGFIYVSGNISFLEQSGSGTLNLASNAGTSSTTYNSILEIGASNVSIFAGEGGPATQAGAAGLQLTSASFALALVYGANGNTYYGLMASAQSIGSVGLPSGFNVTGSNLFVAINGGADSNGYVADFASSFGNGSGLVVSTGGGNSQTIAFTQPLVQVYGQIALQFGSFISIQGGFNYSDQAGVQTILLGQSAFTGAPDLSLTITAGGNTLFTASGSLDMVITPTVGNTHGTTEITSASLTVPEIKIASVLDVITPTVTITNLAIDNVTGAFTAQSGSTLTITADSINLFPGSSVLSGSVTSSTPGTPAMSATFDLNTGAFSATLQQLSLSVSHVLSASASQVSITYSPAAGSSQQIVSFATITATFTGFGGGNITGQFTNLVIYGDGVSFDSGTLGYTGTISIGSVLSVTNPSITLSSFSATFDGTNTSISASALTVAVDSASLNLGGVVTASATGLSITVSLQDGSLAISATELDFSFSQYLTVTVDNVAINTNPGVGGDYLTVGSATATLSTGGSNPSFSVTGTASDFSIVDVAGSPQFQEGANFGVSFSSPSGGSLFLPSWLGFSITQFSINWTNFNANPGDFTVVLSASINSIQGLPGGVTVSGEITDAVINMGLLEKGEFPITSLGSIGGSVQGTLFGLQVNASFVMGIINLNSLGQIINANNTVTDPTTGNLVSGGSTQVASTTVYVGVAGGATIPGVGGVEIYIGFSQLGPLTVYLSAQFPLILDPVSGIAIGGFSGGVVFDYSLPTPSQPTDLRGISLSPESLTISQWQQQLEMQTITQVKATSSGLSAYSQPFVIEAGVTLYDAYLSQDAFNIKGNMAIQINPSSPDTVEIFVNGTVTLGSSLSFNGYLYANLQVQGALTTASFMFLVDVPGGNVPPVESFGGALKFGFTDSSGNPLVPQAPVATTTQQTFTLSDGTTETYSATTFTAPSQTIGGFYISLSGFLEYSALGYANVTISGGVTLTVTGTEAKLDLLGELNVSFLGDIATAQGEFVVNYANGLQFYGALEVSTGAALAKLQQYGLSVNGAVLFQINTTGVDQTVNLPNAPPTDQSSSTIVSAPALNGSNSTSFTIQGSVVFDVTITGTSSPYATIGYEVNNNTLFQMQGFFDLRITNDPTNGLGLEIFADVNSLTLGSGNNTFLSFSGFGLLMVNSSGLAAEINLSLNSGNAISGVSFSANFQLVINTTSQAVTYNIPPVTVPTSTSASTGTAGITIYNQDGSVAGTVSSLVIPAGPPQGQMQITNVSGTNTGNYATSGAAGPYVVISGVGSLSLEGLSLSGNFYFQVSDSSTGGFVLELVLNVSGNIPSVGTANVTGALEISSQGEVALLAIGASGGNTTSYGSGISLQVSAELAVNTTDASVSQIGGVPLTYNGSNITLAANTVQVVASGTLSLNIGAGTGFVISGNFSTTVTSAGGVTATTITLSGTLTATVGGTTLLTMNASGALVITSGGSNPGVAGELNLTLAGSDPLDGNGFSFTGSFDLEVNTTGVQQIVNVGQGTTTIAAGPGGSTNGGSYLEVHARGTLIFGSATNGFQLQNGDFYLQVGSTGLVVSASASMVIEVNGTQFFYVAASGGLLVTSSGIAASITVNTTLTDPNGGNYEFSGNFTLQANTTGQSVNLGTSQNPITVNAGPGAAGSPAGPYFQLFINGTLMLGAANSSAPGSGLFINGSFYLSVGLNGLTIAANGTLTATLGQTTLLSMTASGVLIITTSGGNAGLAGELSLSFSANNNPLAGSGFSFSGTFNLQVNTTGIQQTVSFGAGQGTTTISAGPDGSSTPGAYFEIYGAGMLSFGTASDGFNLSGSFYLSMSTTTGLIVAVNAAFSADAGGTSLLTMNASGVLVINGSGLAGELVLTLAGADPLSGVGFTFNGTFGLVVNTTLTSQTVSVGSGANATTATISAGANGSSTGAVYFEVYASGSLIFGSSDQNGNLTNGFGLTGASLYMSISTGSGLAISASASLEIAINGTQVVSASASGAMFISSAGIAATLTASASLNSPGNTNLYTFGGKFSLQLNTTGVQQNIVTPTGTVTIQAGPGSSGSPAGPYFQVFVSGTLALGTGSVTNSTGIFVAGSFYLSVSTQSLIIAASGTLSVNVAGATLFQMTAVGGLILNYGGSQPGLAGALILTVGSTNPLSGSGFAFSGSFTLELNTTLVSQQIQTPTQNITISAGADGSSTPGAYFQITAQGFILFGTNSTGFALTGSFFLSIQTDSNNLPVLFVSANVAFTTNLFGQTILSLTASGAMEISSAGLAASFTLTASSGSPSLSQSGAFTFNGTFFFAINTTSKAVNDQVGAVTLNVAAGPYFEIQINGGSPSTPATLSLGGGPGLTLSGEFTLIVSSQGLQVALYNATLSLAGLITFNAEGALLINSSGIAAKVSLSLSAGNSLLGNSFSLSASFLLEINSTHSAVNNIAGDAVNLPGGPYFQVVANGSLELGGASILSIMGSFTFTVSTVNNQVQVEIMLNASLNLFGAYFSVVGMAGFYSDGIALSISLSLGGSNSPTLTVIPYVLALSGSFQLQINTTGSSHFGISAETLFNVSVYASVNLFGFSIAQTQINIGYSNNTLTAAGSFNLNFFGLATLQIYFYFDTAGHYAFYGYVGVQLGSDSFNIHGSLTLIAANYAYNWGGGISVGNNILFQITISGGVTAFGWNFASISATLSISSSYDVSVSVYVSISFYFFSIGGTVSVDLGTIGAPPAPPPPPALGVVLINPTVDGTSFTGNILLLDLGQYADTNRGVPALPNENYTITAGSGGVSVTAAGVYNGSVFYAGVTEIVAPNSDVGSAVSNVTITIDGAITLQVVIFSGHGKNHYYLGGGPTTVNGDGGTDAVVGGSGNVTFNVGGGNASFIGGAAQNIIINDPGSLTVTESGYNNYDLNGNLLTYGPGYTDQITGPATITLTSASTGAATFTLEQFNGADFSVTLIGNSNSGDSVNFNYPGNITLTSTVVSSQTYGEIQADGGTVVLENIPNVTLVGSTAGDLLTVTNGADLPSITLQGPAGSDTFVVNLLGSNTYNVNVGGSGTGNSLVVNGVTGNQVYSVSSQLINLKGEAINFLGIQTTTLNAEYGSDTVNIQSIANETIVNLAPTSNVINVGSRAPVENSGVVGLINGLLIIAGQGGGSNTLNLDDSGDATPGSFILTTSTISGSIFSGSSSVAYQNVGLINVFLSNQNNTVDVRGMSGTVNITLGNGVNFLNIGSNAGPIITDPNTGNSQNTGSVLDQITGTLNFYGTGANIFNLDDSGSLTGVDGALTLNSKTNLQVVNFVDPVSLATILTINLPTVASINIALSQGADLFAVSDTFTSSAATVNSGGSTPTTPVVIDGNGGNDNFVILDTHAIATVNGGDGNDSFYNFGNSAVLNLNGNAGDDTFYIYASAYENTSNVDPGGSATSGNAVYSYRINAQVNINGGSGFNTVYIFGTQYNDVITVNGNTVTGSGIDVNLTSVQKLVIEGLGGNDTFYIESVTIPTTIYGDGSIVSAPSLNVLQALGVSVPTASQGTPGSDTFYVGWQGASYIPGSLAGFTAPLTIYGDNGPNLNGSTTNVPGTNDTIYVNDTADLVDQQFTLNSSTLTGTAFGTGGMLTYDPAVENLDIYTGGGNNTFTINGTGTATQTSIYAGAGNDSFIVNASNTGPLQTPLNLFGGLNTTVGDSLLVNGAPAGNTFTITGTTIQGLGAVLTYEQMEQLTITGAGNTTFIVNGDSANTTLNGGFGSTVFNVNSNVVALALNGGNQANTFNINANAGMLTAAGGSDGNVFAFNANSGTLIFTGGVGNDTITVNGNGGTLTGTGSSSPNAFVINANSGSLTLSAGASGSSFVINGNSGSLTLNGGSGNDTFTVNSLSAAAVINGGKGSDLFYVSGPLGAALTVNGGGNQGSLLTVYGTAGNDFITLTSTSIVGLGATITYGGTNLTLDGVSGNDTFLIQGTSAFITRVNGGTFGNDVFDIQANTGELDVTGSSTGNNTFNIGSAAPLSGGVLTGLVGKLVVTGGSNLMRLINLAPSGTNVLNIDDSGSVISGSAVLTSSSLVGLGLGAGITYSFINSLNITLGLGQVAVSIQSTNLATRATVNTGPAADVVNIGSQNLPAAGLLSGIQGPLSILGAGSDTLVFNDAADTATLSGALTATTLSGLGMGSAGVSYSGVSALNLYLGSGAVTMNVISTAASTASMINTGAGSDTINVGSNAPLGNSVLTGIQGGLTLVGNGSDVLNVDDTGDTAGQSTGVLSSSTILGLGMGSAGISYSGLLGLTSLNINLGSGNDTFTITGVMPAAVTTVNGGPGNNTAVINVSGNLNAQNLTLLNFATSTITVTGNFSGILNDANAINSLVINGSLLAGAQLNLGSVVSATIGGDLAGLLNVTGLLGTLTINGGAPGQVIAGNVNVVNVLAGYGNQVLNLTVAGVQRLIMAVPVSGGTLNPAIKFALVYDNVSSSTPQVAIRITNPEALPREFNLELLVPGSATDKFDLALVDSTGNAASGVSNIAVQGDILNKLTAPELALFANLTAASRTGVVLPADAITGLEVSGQLPIGEVDVAGIEGLAFAVLTTAAGAPISVSTPLGQGSSLYTLLGDTPVLNSANDAFLIPFTQVSGVRLYAHDDTNADFNWVMTLSVEGNTNLPVMATVQMAPSKTAGVNPLVSSIVLNGADGSVNSSVSVASLTSTGSLGDVTISALGGATVDNAPGLGNVTAPDIFGSINVIYAGIYGVIQTTSGDLGQVIVGSNGLITSVTSIHAGGSITGQIISRGNLVSSISTNGAFSGVIAAQGDFGAIQRTGAGVAVTSATHSLSRFGGLQVAGNDSGQIIVLGNVFGDVSVSGIMTGRLAVSGQSVSGLTASRMGILGNVSVGSFGSAAAIISEGLVGDVTGGTSVYLGAPAGFVAAGGAVNLRSTTLPAGLLLAGVSGNNLLALQAVFTSNNAVLLFDTGGPLAGLSLIEMDLANIKDNGGVLGGTVV